MSRLCMLRLSESVSNSLGPRSALAAKDVEQAPPAPSTQPELFLAQPVADCLFLAWQIIPIEQSAGLHTLALIDHPRSLHKFGLARRGRACHAFHTVV